MTVGFIGWQFGAYYEVIASHMNHMENIIFIIIILAIISYFTYMKLHSNRN